MEYKAKNRKPFFRFTSRERRLVLGVSIGLGLLAVLGVLWTLVSALGGIAGLPGSGWMVQVGLAVLLVAFVGYLVFQVVMGALERRARNRALDGEMPEQ